MLKNEDLDLKVELLNHYLEKLSSVLPLVEKGAKEFETVREYIIETLTKFSLSIKTAKLDKDEINSFLSQPYYIHKDRNLKADEWYIAIPKIFSAVNLGWLHKVTPGFNVFLVNRYSEWFGDLPKFIKHELKMKDPLDIKLSADKRYLVGKDIDKALEKYKNFIIKKDGDKLEIDQQNYFKFLANLINDGILPFTPAPIPAEHLVKGTSYDKFELRPYQQEAWEKLLQFGNIGVYFPPSTGKTFIGMAAMQRIRIPGKRWLVVVPRTTLIEQWQENIEDYTNLQKTDYVVSTYQSAIKKHLDEEFIGMIIDESHHMPSDYFVHLSKIKRLYTIGLTATPQREDGREDYIIALTGQPVGLSWDYFRQYRYIQSPQSHVWIVKTEAERLDRLKRILDQDELKTLIFSDSLKLGAEIEKRFGIDFIHGGTPDKLKKLREGMEVKGIVAASRIADEGVSLKNIERVIEVSWLFGSRHQELQRMTRLLHAADKEKPGIHHVIMMPHEWDRDHKRFWSSMDRGFQIVLHREGEDEKVFSPGESQPVIKERRPARGPPAPSSPRVSKSSNNYDQKLADIKDKLQYLSKMEKECMIQFKYNPHRMFTKEEMCAKVGGSRPRDFASFNKLLYHKLIKEPKPGYYQVL